MSKNIFIFSVIIFSISSPVQSKTDISKNMISNAQNNLQNYVLEVSSCMRKKWTEAVNKTPNKELYIYKSSIVNVLLVDNHKNICVRSLSYLKSGIDSWVEKAIIEKYSILRNSKN